VQQIQPARSSRVYYGWVIVGVTFVGGFFTSVGSVWAIGQFAQPMGSDLGWTRSQIFLALTIRTLLSAVAGPLLEPFLDRRNGARYISLLSAAAMGVSFLGIRWVDAVWQFYLLFGVLGALTQAGSGYVVAITTIPKWFVRNRSRALGVALMGTGFGAYGVFPVQAAISGLGWRDAWFALGIVTLALLVPASLLLRTRPEDMGLLPDNASASGDGSPAAKARRRPDERSLTRGQATRTSAFWLVMAVFAFVGFGLPGWQANWTSFLTDRGYTAGDASVAYLMYGTFSMLARVAWGWLGDRFAVGHLLVACTVLTGACVLVMLHISGMPALVAYMAATGFGVGGWVLLGPLLVADYFGRANLGAVGSLLRPASTVATAAGPVAIALVYDASGGYTWAWMMVAAAWFAAAATVLLARPPRPNAGA